MKVVALHTDFRIYWPARLKALSGALEHRGDSLEIVEICGKGSPYSFAQDNKVNDLKWHILFPDSKPEELSGKVIKPKLFEVLDDINPDVVIAGAIAYPSGALAVQWANSRKNKRVIVFDDAKIEAVKRNGIVNFVKQNIYNGVDAMFYPAEPWITTGEYWGFKKDRMFFGVDVVDNDFWKEKSDEKPFDFKYFVAVGRQIPKKNFLNIVKAFHLYLNNTKEDASFNLVLIGEGPEHQKIVDYIENNDISNKITCIPFQNQEYLRDIYHNSDMLILCSDNTETWGLVINEAMVCGCSIIASKECGASGTLVIPGKNGYKISYNDIEGMANAMINYHNLSETERNLMKESSKEIISNWGLEKFCDGAIRACDFVVSNPKRKGSFISKLLINKWFGQYKPI